MASMPWGHTKGGGSTGQGSVFKPLHSNSVWSRGGTLMGPTIPLYRELLASSYQDQGHLEWSAESTYTRQHSTSLSGFRAVVPSPPILEDCPSLFLQVLST